VVWCPACHSLLLCRIVVSLRRCVSVVCRGQSRSWLIMVVVSACGVVVVGCRR
jgi:hypothetical protein